MMTKFQVLVVTDYSIIDAESYFGMAVFFGLTRENVRFAGVRKIFLFVGKTYTEINELILQVLKTSQDKIVVFW